MNSRSKGNRNERVAAKLISDWTGRKFERTPSSGGLQWKASFSKGDVVCTVDKHYCPFCFEIKAHKEIDFSHLLNPKIKNVKILEFWNQCKRDAKKCGKIPILMMRYNGMPSEFFFIVMPQKFYTLIRQKIGRAHNQLIYVVEDKYALGILPSDDWFELSYKEIRLIAKTYLKDAKIQKRGKP